MVKTQHGKFDAQNNGWPLILQAIEQHSLTKNVNSSMGSVYSEALRGLCRTPKVQEGRPVEPSHCLLLDFLPAICYSWPLEVQIRRAQRRMGAWVVG